MHSGVLRAYPLGPGGDQRSLSSLGAYWALSLHDNQYGHLWHARFSHDGRFVLTAGEDGNIFSLAVPLPREDGPPGRREPGWGPGAKVPSPRVRPNPPPHTHTLLFHLSRQSKCDLMTLYIYIYIYNVFYSVQCVYTVYNFPTDFVTGGCRDGGAGGRH